MWAVLASTDSLDEFCQAWLVIQSRMISGAIAGLLLFKESQGGFASKAVWPDSCADLTHLKEVAQTCLMQHQGLVRPYETRDGAVSILVAYPIAIDTGPVGTVVLHVATRPEGELQSVLRALHWGVGWLEALLRRQQAVEHARRLDAAGMAMDTLAVLGETERLPEAAMALANELARRLKCERVSIGLERKGRVRLQAISNSAHFDRKSQLVANIENAMEEALDQRQTVTYPQVDGLPQAIAIAHRDLGAAGGVCSVVIPNCGANIGVLTLERAVGATFSERDVELAQAAASLAGPILELKHETNRWFAGRLANWLRAFGRDLANPRRPSFRLGLAVAIFAALFLLFADGEYRVSAKSVVEGEVQRALVAPFEGFIAEAPVRAGQTVKAGTLLARLDDRDLTVERDRLSSECSQHEGKYREALAKRERAAVRILAAQIAEAQARLTLVEEKLSRTQIRAPIDGIVVTGDLSQMLGSPVEQGKLLFEIAPLDAYRVILKVDERDVRHVAAGKQGTLVLSGLTGDSLPFTVHNISTANAEEGGNFFRVEAGLHRPGLKLRPGMEGVGKIVIGERRLAWIWTHRLTDWLRLKLWTWLP